MLLEFTLPLVSHPLCAHILLQIIACWYIKGIFLHLLCQWKFYNSRSLSCFYCFSKQNICGIVTNKITAGPQSLKFDLTHCGETYIVQTPSIFCQKVGQLTVPSTAVWVQSSWKLPLPCLIPKASEQPVPIFYPPAVLHLFQILKQKRNLIAK